MIEEILSYFYDIPLIGPVIKYITEFNIILGLIIISISAFIIINGLLSTHLNQNIIHRVVAKLKDPDKYKNKRNKFYKSSVTTDFSDWQLDIIKSLYSDEVKLNNVSTKDFPVVSFAPEKYTDIVSLQKKLSLDISSKYEYQVSKAIGRNQKSYYKLVEATIKRPELLGYKLDKLLLENNKVKEFTAGICTYKENIMTSHYLEYELFKAYKKYGDEFKPLSKEEKLNRLPYLKSILNGENVYKAITNGLNRASLLSVQMMIVFKDYRDDKYKTFLIQRSEEVSSKPNYWQIVPSGGFEIFEKSNQRSDFVLKDNFKVELALYRELAEEILNYDEFTHNENGNVKENIYEQNDIKEIRKYINDGQASLDFIGVVTDLINFRSELCFLLIIDSPDFIKRRFAVNHEGKDIHMVPIYDNENGNVEDLIKEQLFLPVSASLYQLATQHPKIQKILEDESENPEQNMY